MFGTSDIPEWCSVEALSRPTIEDLSAEHYGEMYKMSPISTPLKIPGLIFIGQKDRRVPHDAAKIYSALSKAKGTPMQLYMFPESDHRLVDSVETSVDIVVKTMLFLE
jgi:dipeptidyl aminopeptidase/acylaminoacyl peptidase